MLLIAPAAGDGNAVAIATIFSRRPGVSSARAMSELPFPTFVSLPFQARADSVLRGFQMISSGAKSL
ncbi:MAG: hypothetical protein AB7E24_00720 [Novosphingobium sp.]